MNLIDYQRSYIYKNVALFLLVITLFISNHNYIILSIFFPGEQRYQSVLISPEAIIGIIFILGIIYILLKEVIRDRGKYINYPLYGLIIFFIWSSISLLHNDIGFRPIITLIGILSYFWGGRFLARNYSFFIHRKVIPWLMIINIMFLLSLFYLYLSNRFFFHKALKVEILQPHIEGGIRSSEISIYLGVLILYLIYCIKSTKIIIYRFISLSLLLIDCALIMLFYSVGTIVALIIVVMLYMMLLYRKKAGYLKIIYLSIFGIMIIIMILNIDIFSFIIESISLKISDIFDAYGIRGTKYLFILSLIRLNMIYGIGWGQFAKLFPDYMSAVPQYPHNNILGIALELGLIAAIAYVMFMVMTIYYGLSTINSAIKNKTELDKLIFLALGCFLYFNLKGLIQDTWQIKETYLWAGVIIGLAELYLKQPQIKYNQINIK